MAWLLAVLVLAGGSPAAAGDERAAVTNAQEAVLARENELLRRQVEALSQSLAGARAERDALKARLDRWEFDEAGGGGAEAVPDAEENALVLETELRLVDVNKKLGMAVLNAGWREGVKPGMRFAVVREGLGVGRARVVDVRRDVAGAVIEQAAWGSYPAAKDRAVMAGSVPEKGQGDGD